MGEAGLDGCEFEGEGSGGWAVDCRLFGGGEEEEEGGGEADGGTGIGAGEDSGGGVGDAMMKRGCGMECGEKGRASNLKLDV